MQLGTRRPFQRARLKYDPTFALEAGYTYDHGIPYEEFLERWGPEDRAKVAAVALERAQQCPRCGTDPQVWAEDPFAYEPVFVGCMGCKKKEILEADDTPRPKGTSIQLVTKAQAAKMRSQVVERPKRRRVAGER